MNFKFDKKNNTISFQVDNNTYPLEAILNTAYILIDRAYIFLDTKKNKIIVYIKGKKKLGNTQLQNIVDEFSNELLNQVLRMKIGSSNKKIREHIISRALFSANPQEEKLKEDELDKELEEILKEVDAEDYKSDPLGIAMPWEEKFGKKSNKKGKTNA